MLVIQWCSIMVANLQLDVAQHIPHTNTKARNSQSCTTDQSFPRATPLPGNCRSTRRQNCEIKGQALTSYVHLTGGEGNVGYKPSLVVRTQLAGWLNVVLTPAEPRFTHPRFSWKTGMGTLPQELPLQLTRSKRMWPACSSDTIL